MCVESELRQAADLEIQDTGLTWDVLGNTNTEDLGLGRVTFALYTETGSTNFRVEVLGKASALRIKCNSPFLPRIDSAKCRRPPALFVFLCPSLTPSRRQLLPINQLFAKENCFNSEIKVEKNAVK